MVPAARVLRHHLNQIKCEMLQMVQMIQIKCEKCYKWYMIQQVTLDMTRRPVATPPLTSHSISPPTITACVTVMAPLPTLVPQLLAASLAPMPPLRVDQLRARLQISCGTCVYSHIGQATRSREEVFNNRACAWYDCNTYGTYGLYICLRIWS